MLSSFFLWKQLFCNDEPVKVLGLCLPYVEALKATPPEAAKALPLRSRKAFLMPLIWLKSLHELVRRASKTDSLFRVPVVVFAKAGLFDLQVSAGWSV